MYETQTSTHSSLYISRSISVIHTILFHLSSLQKRPYPKIEITLFAFVWSRKGKRMNFKASVNSGKIHLSPHGFV